MNENKERNIGLDFLRIISMIMVLILHYLSKGGLLKESNSYSVNYIIYNILKIASIIAVNCYVLISSYFLVKSKFRIKKFLKLWLEVIFYSVSIYLLLVMFGLIQFNFGDAIQSILPIISKQYWFITVYLVMYLLSPFLNKLIYALDKEEYRKLLIIIMIIFSGMTLLPSKWTLDETYGYGIIWFICLYLIGAYIRLYISNDYIEKHHNKWLVIYFACIFLITIIKLTIKKLCALWGINGEGDRLLAYNNPIVLIEAIALFLYCNSLKVKNKYLNKIILNVAPLSFAVYLIHEQIGLREILYTKILHTEICYHNAFGVIIVIGSVVLTFIICITIEYLRKSSMLFLKNKIEKIKKGVAE